MKSIRNKQWHDDIIEYCTKLNEDRYNYSISTYIIWYINGLTDFPKCRVCGKPLRGMNASLHGGYHSHCSVWCRNHDPEIRARVRQKLKGRTIFQNAKLSEAKRELQKTSCSNSISFISENVVINPIGIEISGVKKINKDKAYHHLVYRIVNKKNGHCYIGKHSTGNPFDNYLGSGVAIRDAILVYGIPNFRKEILEDCDSLSEAFDLERKLCGEAEADSSNVTYYNLRPGGIGGCTKETAAKVIATRNRNNKLKLSEATKRKISVANKGVPKSEFHKDQLSLHHRSRHTYRIYSDKEGYLKTVTSTIPRICKELGIQNVQQLRRMSNKGKFFEGYRLEKTQ